MLPKRLIEITLQPRALCGARFSLRRVPATSRSLKRALHPKRPHALLLFAALVFSCTGTLRAQWIQGYDEYFPDIVTAGHGVFYAGSNSGNVSVSSDNGLHWTDISYGLTSSDVYALLVSDTNLIAGTRGGIFVLSPHGEWTRRTSFFCTSLTRHHNAIFAGGVSVRGIVYRSDDNGMTWSVADSLSSDGVAALASVGSELIAGTAYFNGMQTRTGIFRSSDDGVSWQQSNTGLLDYDICSFTNMGNDIVFAGTRAGIYRSTDTGNTWSLTGFKTYTIHAMTVSRNALFEASDSGVFVSQDSGATWRFDGAGLDGDSKRATSFAQNDSILVMEAGGPYFAKISDLLPSVSAVSLNESGFSVACYPNPFASSTTIRLQGGLGHANISIVNLLGVEVARIFSGELAAGEHSFTWSASETHAPQGIYECLIRMNGRVETRPVMLIRP